MLPTSAGVEPSTSRLQSDGASNWVTEAGSFLFSLERFAVMSSCVILDLFAALKEQCSVIAAFPCYPRIYIIRDMLGF